MLFYNLLLHLLYHDIKEIFSEPESSRTIAQPLHAANICIANTRTWARDIIRYPHKINPGHEPKKSETKRFFGLELLLPKVWLLEASGSYIGIIVTILGFCRDNEKENGSYYNGARNPRCKKGLLAGHPNLPKPVYMRMLRGLASEVLFRDHPPPSNSDYKG